MTTKKIEWVHDNTDNHNQDAELPWTVKILLLGVIVWAASGLMEMLV